MNVKELEEVFQDEDMVERFNDFTLEENDEAFDGTILEGIDLIEHGGNHPTETDDDGVPLQEAIFSFRENSFRATRYHNSWDVEYYDPQDLTEVVMGTIPAWVDVEE